MLRGFTEVWYPWFAGAAPARGAHGAWNSYRALVGLTHFISRYLRLMLLFDGMESCNGLSAARRYRHGALVAVHL